MVIVRNLLRSRRKKALLTGCQPRTDIITRRKVFSAESATSSAKNIGIGSMNRLLDIDINDFTRCTRPIPEVMYGADQSSRQAGADIDTSTGLKCG